MEVIANLVVRMARENPCWGYTLIQGALSNLGHRVGRTTVANIIRKNGIDPVDGFLADKEIIILDRDSKGESTCRSSSCAALPD
jgi:hypothetical protein